LLANGTERRLQTLAALFWLIGTPPFAIFFTLIATFLCCMIPVVGPVICILYYGWVFLVDKTPTHGGRPIDWVRRWVVWKYFADFFPAKLIKTVDLDPKKRYIFGSHPHGILSIGAFLTFCTEALGWSEKFPGINVRCLTLTLNFKFPFHREYMQSVGTADVSESSCLYNLRPNEDKVGPNQKKSSKNQTVNSNRPNAIVIVPGGAQEALDTHNGTTDLTLNKRRGFVRIALKTGAELVPVFCFGENSTYYCAPNPVGSWLRSMQEMSLKILGFSLPVFHGRGMFNKNLGLLPFRSPLTIVIGKPIPVPKIDNPTQDEISKYHAIYVQGLRDLYDQYKDEYDKERISELRVVR